MKIKACLKLLLLSSFCLHGSWYGSPISGISYILFGDVFKDKLLVQLLLFRILIHLSIYRPFLFQLSLSFSLFFEYHGLLANHFRDCYVLAVASPIQFLLHSRLNELTNHLVRVIYIPDGHMIHSFADLPSLLLRLEELLEILLADFLTMRLELLEPGCFFGQLFDLNVFLCLVSVLFSFHFELCAFLS